jgi:hypothetical protein
MHILRLAPLALLSLLIVGCSDKQPAEAPPPQDTASSPSGQVELLPSPTSQEAFPLATGSFISGSFTAPRAGTISSVSVVIGNYDNTSDGDLTAKLCQNEQCETGSADLAQSADNQYLAIALEHPVKVSGNAPITYTFTRTHGTKPMAIWTYAPSATLTQMKVNSDAPMQRTPNIAITFAN